MSKKPYLEENGAFYQAAKICAKEVAEEWKKTLILAMKIKQKGDNRSIIEIMNEDLGGKELEDYLKSRFNF